VNFWKSMSFGYEYVMDSRTRVDLSSHSLVHFTKGRSRDLCLASITLRLNVAKPHAVYFSSVPTVAEKMSVISLGDRYVNQVGLRALYYTHTRMRFFLMGSSKFHHSLIYTTAPAISEWNLPISL